METALLLGKGAKQNDVDAKSPLSSLVAAGSYVDVLKSDAAQELFRRLGNDATDVEREGLMSLFASRISSAVSSSSDSSRLASDFLCVGIACLNLFVQHNWTGPTPRDWKLEDAGPLGDAISPLASTVPQKRAFELLSADNEDAYSLTRGPQLLVVALGILESLESALPTSSASFTPSLNWWKARALAIQQKTLDNPSATLYETILECMEKVEAALDQLPAEPDLLPFFYLEYGLVHHYHKQDQKAKDMFEKAQSASGLKWEMSGRLGKRTKFQERDHAQLVVVAESAGDAQPDAGKSVGVPEILPLNDELLLEKIAFKEDDGSKKSLRVVDQALLLAFCLNIRNTNPANGLTQEEMLAYVNRILDDDNKDFSVTTMGLLLRSRIESTKSRTVERSILQLQTLVDQIYPLASSGTKTDQATVHERLARFWFVDSPSLWQLERELGERWLTIGMIVSALEIFERLQLWEDTIECYRSMEKLKKAEELLRQRLDVTPNSPKLWCLMGDVTGDPIHWQHAWELSERANRRYSRAMRSLGSYWFKKGDYRQSMECYGKALAINPLYENSWFVLGCAALQVEDLDTASMAFSRVVSLNHENAEGWSNLASVYIRQRKRNDAFVALRQALKQEYENWKIWQNYLYIATDLGELGEAIKAMERLVELRWQRDKGDSVDLEVLNILTDQAVKMMAEGGQNAEFMSRRMSALFDAIVEKIANVPAIWTAFAKFERARGDPRKAIEMYQKAYRTLVASGDADNSEGDFEALASATLDLVDAYRILGPQKVREDGDELVAKDWLYQARMTLRTVVGRARKNWEHTETFAKLSETLEGLKST